MTSPQSTHAAHAIALQKWVQLWDLLLTEPLDPDDDLPADDEPKAESQHLVKAEAK